ncbi:MAG TPA: hypothetical protein DCY07_01300 [Rhodospirillaceae bacterium]|nr:hypothetical protein [Rhodospirillaceae bacterium]
MKMLVDLSIACKQFSKPLPPIAIYSAEGKEKVSAFIGQVKQEKNISSIENWSPLARSGSYVLGLANRIIQFQKTNGVHQP